MTDQSHGPLLPSRYEQVLNQRVAEHASKLLAASRAASPPFEMPRWGKPALAIGVLGIAALVMAGSSDTQDRSRVAFDRSSVISSGSVGLQASAEEMIPPPTATAPPEPEPQPPEAPEAHLHAAELAEPPPAPPTRPRPRASTAAEGKCLNCEAKADAPMEILVGDAEAEPVPSPAAAAPRSVINVGTRFGVVLTHPVSTAFAGSPVTGRLQTDVASGGRVLVPAGATLVGEAFATDSDNRAQIVFTALVVDGRTVPFRGIAFSADNELGVPGKVVRKASGTRKGAGRVINALGSALGYGLLGQDNGVLGAAAANVAVETAQDLSSLNRTWTEARSDKVIHVKPGTQLVVYVQADVRIE